MGSKEERKKEEEKWNKRIVRRGSEGGGEGEIKIGIQKKREERREE